MAVTLTDQYGDTSTPTLTSGSDNCDYVLVVGADYVDRYGKTGDTSYRFAMRSQGLGGLTAGHIIGVSYVEGGRSLGDGISNVLDGADVDLTAPTEGDLLTLGPGGVTIVNRADVTLEMDANTVLLGQGTGSAPIAATMAQLVTALALKGMIPIFDDAPADGTYVIIVRVPYALTVNSFTADVDSGTFTAAITINGTNITGLSAVEVSSTKATTNATAANTAVAGDEIAIVYSLASTPVNFRGAINFTRTGI